jgi:putative hemolysin
VNGDVTALVAVVLLLLVTAYLAALETVLSRLNVVRALRLVEEDRRGAAPLLWVSEHRVSGLNVLLVVTVAARVTLAAIAAVLGWRHLGGAGGLAIAVAVVALLSLIVGEVAPRTVVLRHLETSGLASRGAGSC